MKTKLLTLIAIILLLIFMVGRSFSYWLEVEEPNTINTTNYINIGSWIYSEHPGYIRMDDIVHLDKESTKYIEFNGIDMSKYTVVVFNEEIDGYNHFFKMNLREARNMCEPNTTYGCKPPSSGIKVAWQELYTSLFYYHYEGAVYPVDVVTSVTVNNEAKYFYSKIGTNKTPEDVGDNDWCLIHNYDVLNDYQLINEHCLGRRFVSKGSEIYKVSPEGAAKNFTDRKSPPRADSLD